MSKREIFGIGGPAGYSMCDVLMDDHIKEGYLLVQAPNGQEYVAVPAYGTWTAITPYDMLYKLKWLKETNKRLQDELTSLKEHVNEHEFT